MGYGTEIPLPVRATGTVTWLPEQGVTVRRGGALLRVDDRPVVLLYGRLPMYRDLGLTATTDTTGTTDPTDSESTEASGSGADGERAAPTEPPASAEPSAPTELKGMDVLQFETNLAALGYTGFTVDETFTAKTAQAVERWQRSLGLPETGTVGIGDVVYSTGLVRIGRPGVRLGGAAGENTLTYTGTARKVVVDASAADAAWAVRGTGSASGCPTGRP